MHNELDHNHKSTKDNLKLRTATQNKVEFMNSFSIKFELPTMHILQKKIMELAPGYSIEIAKYLYPQNNKILSYCSHRNEPKATTYQKYQKRTASIEEGTMLQLIKVNGHQEKISRLSKLQDDSIIQFSEDGTLFGVMQPSIGKVDVYQIDEANPERLIELICQDETNLDPGHFCYVHENKDELNFIDKVVFDLNNGFLVGYGKTKVFVLNLTKFSEFQENQKSKSPLYGIYTVNAKLYEQIYALKFKSENGKKRCYVLCKNLNCRILSYFDMLKPLNFNKLCKMISDSSYNTNQCCSTPNNDHQAHNKNQVQIHLTNEITDQHLFAISRDFTHILYTDIHEKSIFQILDDHHLVKRQIREQEGKIVSGIAEDMEDGFFMITSEEHDNHFELRHTHRTSTKIKFFRRIQIDSQRVFDLKVRQLEKTEESRKLHIQLYGARDNDILLNECEFLEVKNNQPVDNQYQTQDLQQYDQMDIKQKSQTFKQIVCFTWPFFVCEGIDGTLQIINVFDQSKIHSIDLKKKTDEFVQLQEIEITESYDLFILVLREQNFELYQIDLDIFNGKKERKVENQQKQLADFIYGEPLLKYSQEETMHQTFILMRVRCTSKNLNQSLMVFLKHGDTIYYWTQKYVEQQCNKIGKFQDMTILRTNVQSPRLVIEDDSSFLFYVKQDNGNQDIIRVKMLYTTLKISTVFSLPDDEFKLHVFDIDKNSKKLLIFFYKKEKIGQDINKFQIYDLESSKLLYETQLQEKELKQRFRSRFYTFVDGHIYYNNNVIKIRYDLLNNSNCINQGENQMFDIYKDIFDLPSKRKVKSTTPIDGHKYHKFGYLIIDSSYQAATEVMILPYLHDRKIYLSKNSNYCDYFFTSMRVNDYDYNDYHKELRHGVSKNLANSIFMKQNTRKWEARGEKKFAFEKQNKEDKIKEYNAIISINLTDQKYHVFHQNGILLNRVDFKSDVEKYGDLISTSQNGLNFIFKKAKFDFEDLQFSTKEIQRVVSVSSSSPDKTMKKVPSFEDQKKGSIDEILESLKINILHIDIFKIRFVKEIKIFEQIRKLLKESQDDSTNQEALQMIESLGNINDINQNLQIEDLGINDHFDVLIKINLKMDSKRLIIFYFENGCHDQSELKLKSFTNRINKGYKERLQNVKKNKYMKTQHIEVQIFKDGGSEVGVFFSQGDTTMDDKCTQATVNLEDDALNKNQLKDGETENMTKFAMNNDSIFFYSKNKIQYYQIGSKNPKKGIFANLRQFDFGYHPKIQIQSIKTGSNNDYIVIIIEQEEEKDLQCFVLWDLKNMKELNGCDQNKGCKILWDHQGEPYFLDEGKVIFPSKKTSVKTFQYNKFDYVNTDLFHKDNKEFTFDKGHCFDGQNHNWLILNEYISLGFSYLTFVMLEKLNKGDKMAQENEFDPEPYNYLFNKSTVFIDSAFVYKDHKRLGTILNKFQLKDPELLGILSYCKEIYDKEDSEEIVGQLSALHQSVFFSNKFSVDIILKYLSLLKEDSSINFMQIFPSLVNYSGFIEYLSKLPEQTKQMENKLVINVNEIFSTDIVKLLESRCIHTDSQLFDLDTKSDIDQSKSYPVDIIGFRIDWIIQTPEGEKFLEKVLQSQNLEFWKIKPFQMLVQYMYDKFKKKLLTIQLPIFILRYVLFEVLLVINEYLMDDIYQCLTNNIEAHQSKQDYLKKSQIFSSFGHFGLRFWIHVLILSILFINIIEFIMIFVTSIVGRFRIFRRLITWETILVLFTSSYLTFVQLRILRQLNQEHSQWEDFKLHSIQLRYAQIITEIFIFVKSFYFLSLFENFAPIIDQIYYMLWSIRHYFMIMLLCGLMFANIFLQLGKNQISFDNIPEEEKELVNYTDTLKSYWFIYYMLIAEPDYSMFMLGDGSFGWPLYVLFAVTTFVMEIFLLNMLIAIMNQTFSERYEVADISKCKDHLQFVMDNFHLKEYVMDTNKINYIIAAFAADYQANDEQKLTEAFKTEIETLKVEFESEIDSLRSGQDQLRKEFKSQIQRQSKVIQNDIQSKHEETLKQFSQIMGKIEQLGGK